MGALDSAASLAAAGGNPLIAAAITGSGSAAQSARGAHEAGADDDFYTGGETGAPVAEGTEAPGASGTEDDAPADGGADGKSE